MAWRRMMCNCCDGFQFFRTIRILRLRERGVRQRMELGLQASGCDSLGQFISRAGNWQQTLWRDVKGRGARNRFSRLFLVEFGDSIGVDGRFLTWRDWSHVAHSG